MMGSTTWLSASLSHIGMVLKKRGSDLDVIELLKRLVERAKVGVERLFRQEIRSRTILKMRRRLPSGRSHRSSRLARPEGLRAVKLVVQVTTSGSDPCPRSS